MFGAVEDGQEEAVRLEGPGDEGGGQAAGLAGDGRRQDRKENFDLFQLYKKVCHSDLGQCTRLLSMTKFHEIFRQRVGHSKTARLVWR